MKHPSSTHNRNRRLRRGLIALALGIGTVGLVVPQLATAAATGNFSCRASGARVASPLLNSEPIVSNKPGNPCADDADEALNVKVGSLVRANVIDTKTDLTPNGNEGAASDVSITGLGVNLGGLTIGASVLTSNATASCVGGVAKLSGKSQVASLNINGVGVSVLDQPLTINIAPLIVISINEQTVGGGKLTQRALHIHSGLLLTDIVIAESVADIHGTPCAAVPPPKPQCSDGVDNDGDGKVDAADPGCHSDGNAGNPGSYVPGDNDESNPPPSSQCSDGVDNDGDGKIDYPADPGCNSPSDNSELDS